MRAYTLNVTLAFITRPLSESFTVPVVAVSAVKDAGKLVELGCKGGVGAERGTRTNLAATNLAGNSAVNWANLSQGFLPVLNSPVTVWQPACWMTLDCVTVLPSARGFCEGRNLHLIITHGNVDQNWLPFISDLHLTPEAVQKYKYSLRDNGTHLAISVPFLSSHVNYEVRMPAYSN